MLVHVHGLEAENEELHKTINAALEGVDRGCKDSRDWQFLEGILSWDHCKIGPVNEAVSSHVDGEVIGDNEISCKNGLSNVWLHGTLARRHFPKRIEMLLFSHVLTREPLAATRGSLEESDLLSASVAGNTEKSASQLMR